MFRLFCGMGSGALNVKEMAAMEQLCSSREALVTAGGIADVRSECGYTACSTFLTSLDKAARTLSLEITPRHYRASFSANYRALFPDSHRHYRVDVFEASLDQHSAIWVNGEKYELSPEAVVHAEMLQKAWADLDTFLDRWYTAWYTERQSGHAKPGRAEIQATLTSFDVAWAEFERRYIGELIAIEERARQVMVRAVSYETKLRALEAQGSASERDRVVTERNLMQCIAQLNSVANFRGKGRDDLGLDVLDRARAVVRDYQSGKDTGRARDAANTLASDVLGSYQAIRGYLRKVGSCIERVDPHLCNNAGLVDRLVDLEETWEVAARYVQSGPLLDAVCDLVAEVRAARGVAPELAGMIEDCDVELFLVLPRLTMLCFLADPAGKRAELVRGLLPHRFSPSGGLVRVDAEMKALFDRFEETLNLVADVQQPGTGSPRAVAWNAMVKQAVLGEERGAGDGLSAGARRGVAELLRAVEGWSLELQRHCPEDWNQCSSVLVHCLAGGAERKPSAKFQV